MSTTNFTAGQFQSFKDDGSINANGTVEFFTPDGAFSTYKTTYSNSDLTTANSATITLSPSGRARVYYVGNADMRTRTSAAVQIEAIRNVNPQGITAVLPVTTNTTLVLANDNQIVQVSGAGVTLTLTDATTLGSGWYIDIANVDSANNVTIARQTAGDSFDGTAANVTLAPLQAVRVFVISAANGFRSIASSITLGGATTKILFTNTGIGPNYLQNIGIFASANAKALTVSITTRLGVITTATDYAQISFRHSTLTTGQYVTRNKTTDGPVVAPSTATLGFTASQTGYVYVYALDNAGTVETIISGSNHWDEATVQSTTTISATADSGSVLYSTTARSNVPIRYVGRIKIQTGAVAGEWDNDPTEIHVGQPTGSAVLGYASNTSTSLTATATFSTALNVNVGDIVTTTYLSTCIRNGADFYINGAFTFSGTCVIDSSGLTDGGLPLAILGVTIHGSQRINTAISSTRKVTTAGTLTSVGLSSYTTVGTAPITDDSFISVTVISAG